MSLRTDRLNNKFETLAGASVRQNIADKEIFEKHPSLFKDPKNVQKYGDLKRNKLRKIVVNRDPDAVIDDNYLARQKNLNTQYDTVVRSHDQAKLAELEESMTTTPDANEFLKHQEQYNSRKRQMDEIDQTQAQNNAQDEASYQQRLNVQPMVESIDPEGNDNLLQRTAKTISYNARIGALDVAKPILGAYDQTIGKIGEDSHLGRWVHDLQGDVGVGLAEYNKDNPWIDAVGNSFRSVVPMIADSLTGQKAAIIAGMFLRESQSSYYDKRYTNISPLTSEMQVAAPVLESSIHGVEAGLIEGGMTALSFLVGMPGAEGAMLDIFGKAGSQSVNKALKTLFKKGITHVAKGAGKGAFQEMWEETITEAIHYVHNANGDMNLKDFWKTMDQTARSSGLMGFFGGGAAGMKARTSAKMSIANEYSKVTGLSFDKTIKMVDDVSKQNPKTQQEFFAKLGQEASKAKVAQRQMQEILLEAEPDQVQRIIMNPNLKAMQDLGIDVQTDADVASYQKDLIKLLIAYENPGYDWDSPLVKFPEAGQIDDIDAYIESVFNENGEEVMNQVRLAQEQDAQVQEPDISQMSNEELDEQFNPENPAYQGDAQTDDTVVAPVEEAEAVPEQESVFTPEEVEQIENEEVFKFGEEVAPVKEVIPKEDKTQVKDVKPVAEPILSEERTAPKQPVTAPKTAVEGVLSEKETETIAKLEKELEPLLDKVVDMNRTDEGYGDAWNKMKIVRDKLSVLKDKAKIKTEKPTVKTEETTPIDTKTFDSYVEDDSRTKMQSGRIKKVLSRQFNYGGKTQTAHEIIEDAYNRGGKIATEKVSVNITPSKLNDLKNEKGSNKLLNDILAEKKQGIEGEAHKRRDELIKLIDKQFYIKDVEGIQLPDGSWVGSKVATKTALTYFKSLSSPKSKVASKVAETAVEPIKTNKKIPTLKEYIEEKYSKWQQDQDNSTYYKSIFGARKSDHLGDVKNAHFDLVKDALLKGDKLPANVLADYKDLAKDVEVRKKSTESQPIFEPYEFVYSSVDETSEKWLRHTNEYLDPEFTNDDNVVQGITERMWNNSQDLQYIVDESFKPDLAELKEDEMSTTDLQEAISIVSKRINELNAVEKAVEPKAEKASPYARLTQFDDLSLAEQKGLKDHATPIAKTGWKQVALGAKNTGDILVWNTETGELKAFENDKAGAIAYANENAVEQAEVAETLTPAELKNLRAKRTRLKRKLVLESKKLEQMERSKDIPTRVKTDKQETVQGLSDEIGSITGQIDASVKATPKRATGSTLRGANTGANSAPGSNAQWTTQTSETKEGLALAKKIKTDTLGKKTGVRSIVDYLNKKLDVLLIQSRSQTSKKYPANYRSGFATVFTKKKGSQINFHEAGHRLFELMDRRGVIDKTLEQTLTSFLDSGLAPQASAQNIQEAFAEWTRQFITNYDSLKGWESIENAVKTTYPKSLTALRDATRAFNEHVKRTPTAKVLSETFDQGKTPPANIRGVVNLLLQKMARGEHASEMFIRDIQRGMKFYETSKPTAKNNLAWFRKGAAKNVHSSHAELSRVRNEVDFVFSGGNVGRNGVRVIKPGETSPAYLTDKSYNDIKDMVPAKQWAQAQIATEVQAALARWNTKGLAYVGMDNGITPADLEAIVAEARDTIPNFDEFAEANKEYFDALLDIAVMAGQFTAEEAQVMKDTYEHYVYLKPAFAPQSGSSSTGEATSGIMKAFGSTSGYADLAEAAYDRTKNVLSLYAEQNAKKSVLNAIDDIQNNDSLPDRLKEIARQTLIPLNLKTKPVATLSTDEQTQIIFDYLSENGFEGDIEDINIEGRTQIFRASKPNDVNVITVYKNGKSKYYMATNPLMYDMYATESDINPVVKMILSEVAAVTRNFTRPITESPAFGILNAGWRDMQRVMSRGEEGRLAIPYYALARGVVGRLAGVEGFNKIGHFKNLNHPELKNAAQLLSHSLHQSESSMINQLGRSEFVNMLAEGWHNTKMPVHGVLRAVINMTHLANIVNVPIKLVDIFNYTVHSRQSNAFFESMSREGVAATKLDTGGSLQDALAAYSDVTGRFGSRPGSTAVASVYQTLPFSNANMQILYESLLDYTSPDAAVRNRVGKRLALLLSTGIAIGALKAVLGDDDDEKEIPTETKARYFTFAGLKVPFGYGLEGMLVNMGYTATREFLSDDRFIRDKEKYAMTLLSQTGQSLSIETSLLPPILKAIRNANINYDSFFNSHIVSPYQSNLEPSEQYRATTPAFYKAIGSWINYSPTKIQYIVRSGVARQIDEAIKVSDRIQKGKFAFGEVRADIPAIGRLFIRKPTGWRSESVRTVAEYNDKYTSFRHKLKNSKKEIDKQTLAYMDGDSNEIDSRLKVQVDSLMFLHKQNNALSRLSSEIKKADDDKDKVDFLKQQMVLRAQAALAGNTDFIDKMDRMSNGSSRSRATRSRRSRSRK